MEEEKRGIPDLGPVDYSNHVPPDNYRCMKCGVHGVRLWRDYNTFVCYNTLRCWDCCEGKDDEGDSVDGFRRGMCAAVPTEDGATYWGIGALAAFGFVWWRRLEPLPQNLQKGDVAARRDERHIMALEVALKNTVDLAKMHEDGSLNWCQRYYDLCDAVVATLESTGGQYRTAIEAEFGDELRAMEWWRRRNRRDARDQRRR